MKIVHVEKWDRAMKFLAKHGHVVESRDGRHVTVDGKDFLIGTVHEFAEQAHREEWSKSEDAYMKAVLKGVPPGA